MTHSNCQDTVRSILGENGVFGSKIKNFNIGYYLLRFGCMGTKFTVENSLVDSTHMYQLSR